MRHLILVRHAAPEIRREVPAAEWRLSAEGLECARALSHRLAPAGATHVFTSVEPKAIQTGEALARAWGIPVQQVAGLHEHERPQAQMLSRAVFEDKIRDLFARPAEVVFGSESADHARRRFTTAVMRLIAQQAGDVVLVTHGTVMTLFVAEVTGIEPFAFWKGQTMPFAVTLTIPELKIASTTSV